MKRAAKETDCLKLTGGSMKWKQIITATDRYRIGTYSHPLGIVTVYNENRVTVISTYHKGILFIRQRRDHPTDRQIANDCRTFLQEL